VPLSVEPEFNAGFMFLLNDGKELNGKETPNIESLLSMSEKIQIIALKKDKFGEFWFSIFL
jgi:hypothetical protein